MNAELITHIFHKYLSHKSITWACVPINMSVTYEGKARFYHVISQVYYMCVYFSCIPWIDNSRLELFISIAVFSYLQKINQELQEALEDKEGLKQQVQEYILEVRRIEDVLASKVRAAINWLV